MSFEAKQILQPELEPEEQLLWCGQPRQGIYFQEIDIFWVPFSLLWGGLTIFGVYMLITDVSYHPTTIPSIVLLVLIGSHLLVGRFFWYSHRRSRIYYGITDKRVIILTGARPRKARSLALQEINKIFLTERSDKAGDIAFIKFSANDLQTMWSQVMSWSIRPNIFGIYPAHPWPTFERIENARQVYNIVLEAQRQA